MGLEQSVRGSELQAQNGSTCKKGAARGGRGGRHRRASRLKLFFSFQERGRFRYRTREFREVAGGAGLQRKLAFFGLRVAEALEHAHELVVLRAQPRRDV